MQAENPDGATPMKRWALALLDRNPAAMFLLDEHHRVLYTNRCATQLCAAGDGISLSAQGLTLPRKQDADRLQSLITAARSAAAGQSISPIGTLRVARPSGRRAYILVVASTARRHEADSRLPPVVGIVISDPDGETPLSSERLRAAFGLTKAEARLAALIGAGEELRSAAAKLKITYGTARARLAGIFEKTQTRRQGELIKLLLTSIAALS